MHDAVFPIRLLVVVLCFLMVPSGCRQEPPRTGDASARISVVTTIFPVYDFARTICGDRGEVTMLLPPGGEAHSFDPRPSDIATIGKADLFVYTLKEMEPWVPKLLDGIGKQSLLVVEAGKGTRTIPAQRRGHEHKTDGGEDHDHGHDSGIDPHVWLDLSNAAVMVEAIAVAASSKDPANAPYYRANADTLKKELLALDEEFSRRLFSCRSRTIVHGGHFAFGYLAKRYGLTYVAAQAVNPDAEPTPATMARLIGLVRREKLSHVFSEAPTPPRIAETIAREAKVQVLPLHAAHTVGSNEFKAGVSFVDLMRRNLDNLEKGLGCSPSP